MEGLWGGGVIARVAGCAGGGEVYICDDGLRSCSPDM